MLLGLLAAALSGGGVIALAIAHVAASAVATTVAFFVTARIYGARPLARAIFRAPHHPAMERFSLPLAISELLAALSQYFHAILLPLWVTNAALLGVFFGAEYFARAINNTRYGFDTVFCPIVSEAHEHGDRARIQDNLSLLSRWVFSLALPLVLLFCLFPESILSIAGRDFYSGAVFLVAFAIAMGLYSAFGLTGWVITMTGRPRLTLLNNAIAVIANLALSLALVPAHGAYGALIATIAAMLLVRILENVEAYALARVHLIRAVFFKPLIAALVSCAVQLIAAPLIPNPLARVIVATSVGFAAYLVSFVALGLTTDEWRMLERLKWVRRLRGGKAA
jgi:O-antigen/teichoic acid export membrane protein